MEKHKLSITIFTIIVLIFFFAWLINSYSQIEIDGSCNTGFIGVDFQSDIKNQPYLTERQISSRFDENGLVVNNMNFTVFNQEFFPKVFNVKNIDGLNCNYHFKGNGLIMAIILGELN